MALTAAQLTTFDTNVNFGIPPTAAEALLITAWAQQTQAASLSDAQAEENVLAFADGETDVALATYQFFTGSAPTLAGMQYLVNGGSNPNDLGSAYYAGFNTENRYYNFAINLATDPASAAAAPFAAAYGSVSFSDAVKGAYEAIVGTSAVGAAAAAAAEAAIIAAQPYFAQIAHDRTGGANQDLATKAIAIGYILEEAVKANVGAYAFAINSFDLALGLGGTPAFGQNLLTAYPINSIGQTFELTPDIDHFVGGSGNNTINAVTDGSSGGEVINDLDYIDGGVGGINTFNVVNNQHSIEFGTVGTDGADTEPNDITLINVQNVNIQSSQFDINADLTGDAALVNVTAVTGNAAATIEIYGGQSITATGGTNVDLESSALINATVNNTSGGTITITNYDVATQTDGDGATLNTVTLNGVNDADVDILSSSLSTLNLNNAGGGGFDAVFIENMLAAAPVLTINANVVQSYIEDNTGNFSNPEIDLNVTGANTIQLWAPATTTLKVGGTGRVNLVSGNTNLSSVTTFNASANSGGVTVTDGFALNAVVIGGLGNDTVFLSGATGGSGSISLGGGNDALLDNAGLTGAITPGALIDGGSGVNTISAYLVNGGNANFITNFQLLDVSNYGAAPHNGLDASLLGTRPTGLTLSTADANGTATILNLADNASVTDFNGVGGPLTGDIMLTHVDGAGTLAVNFAQMVAGADTFNITSTGDTAVTVASGGVAGSSGTLTLTETDNHLATITVSGGNDLNLAVFIEPLATPANNVAAALGLIDAHALTGDFTIIAGGDQATAGAGNVTFSGLVIDGGTGDNFIENDAAGGVINVAASQAGSASILVVTGAGSTINDAGSGGIDFLEVGLGAANPIFTTGQSATVTLGSGTGTEVVFHDVAGVPGFLDTLHTGAAVNADIVDYLHYDETVTANSIVLDGNLLAINGSVTGHELDFANNLSNPTGSLGLAVNVGAAQNLGQAVFLADQATTSNDQAVWFKFGGSDYILVSDHIGLHDTTNDQVVQIVGSQADLTFAQITGAHLVF